MRTASDNPRAPSFAMIGALGAIFGNSAAKLAEGHDGRALRPLWQVLTRISGPRAWTIVADWAEEQVCQRCPSMTKSADQRARP